MKENVLNIGDRVRPLNSETVSTIIDIKNENGITIVIVQMLPETPFYPFAIDQLVLVEKAPKPKAPFTVKIKV